MSVIAPTPAAEPAPHRIRPFGRLLTYGMLYTAALQLTSVSAILPFICVQQGYSWAAGLVYPAFCLGAVVAHLTSPMLIARFAHRSNLVIAGAATITGAAVVGNALIVESDRMALLLLMTSALFGLASGVASVAFSDIASTMLDQGRRGQLLLNQSAAGSAIAAFTVVVLVPMLAEGDGQIGEAESLWFGAAAFIAASAAAIVLAPKRSKSSCGRPLVRDTLRRGVSFVRTHQWFRRYVVTQLLFVPITLGANFYSLRAAAFSGDDPDSLPTLIILASCGLIIGCIVWRLVYRAKGVRGMLLGSASLAAAASVLCIAIEIFPEHTPEFLHSMIFLLATIANQAVFASAISWLSAYANDDQRAMLIAFGAMLVTAVSSGAGLALGSVAQQTTSVWPLIIVLVLSALAVTAARGAPPRQTGTPQ